MHKIELDKRRFVRILVLSSVKPDLLRREGTYCTRFEGMRKVVNMVGNGFRKSEMKALHQGLQLETASSKAGRELLKKACKVPSLCKIPLLGKHVR